MTPTTAPTPTRILTDPTPLHAAVESLFRPDLPDEIARLFAPHCLKRVALLTVDELMVLRHSWVDGVLHVEAHPGHKLQEMLDALKDLQERYGYGEVGE